MSAPTTAPTKPAAGATTQPGAAFPATAAGRASQLITGRGSATTPRRLRLIRLGLLVLALVLAVGAVVTSAMLRERQALTAVHAAQYTRATAIETGLLRAHAAASQEFLSGSTSGLGDPQAALDEVAWLVVQVAAEGTDDTEQLAAISQGLLRYGEQLQSATQQRGTAAGRAALSGGYELLQAELLPAAQDLQAAHHPSSTSAVPWWMWLLPVLAWLTVLAVLGASWYTARISHRILNPGLLVALVASIVVAVFSGTVLTGQDGEVSASVQGRLARTEALTTAQRSAAAAHALLSQQVAAEAWTTEDAGEFDMLTQQAAAALDPSDDEELLELLTQATTASAEVVDQASTREWAKAAAALVETGDDSPSWATAGFLDDTGSAVDLALADVRSAVAAWSNDAVTFAVLAVLCALGGGYAAGWGLHQRLKEYR